MTDRSLTLSAPAKINLYLGVHTERDDRGYHRVDSLMAAAMVLMALASYRYNKILFLVEGIAGADRPDGSSIRFSHAKEYGVSGCGCYGRALWSRGKHLRDD